MDSKMDRTINELEEFIQESRPVPFSSANISVNKDDMITMLTELRACASEEIQKYQKLINNQDKILADANAKANAIMAEARARSEKMIADTEAQIAEMLTNDALVKRAEEQAGAMIEDAAKQVEASQRKAQSIMDDGADQATQYRRGAIDYTDEMLGAVESIVKKTLDDAEAKYKSFRSALEDTYSIILSNREELADTIQRFNEEA